VDESLCVGNETIQDQAVASANEPYVRVRDRRLTGRDEALKGPVFGMGGAAALWRLTRLLHVNVDVLTVSPVRARVRRR
jgi:hypothetical protein